MASFVNLIKNRTVRLLIIGFPKSGKTGALACLADAGFKLRILDYDHNLEPLFAYITNPAPDINAISLRDPMKVSGDLIGPVGKPKAFIKGFRLMDHWVDPDDGTDCGKSDDWGPDTIVVLDAMGSMGDASMVHSLHRAGKDVMTRRDTDYGAAMGDQERFIKELTAPHHSFHVIVLCHPIMIGPKAERKGDTAIALQNKQEIAGMIETRYYPNALGWKLPQTIGGEFPAIIQAEETKGKRILRTVPKSELDLGVPAVELPATLPQETGLLTIFEKLTPGITWCLDPKNNPEPKEGT